MLDLNTPINSVPVVALDVETTGLYAYTGDRIIEIGVVRVEPDGEHTAFDSLVNPGRPIDKGASNVNGIWDDDVATAPTFAEIAPQVSELLTDAVLVAHNAPFDLSFISAEFAIAKMSPPESPVVDTLALARNFYYFRSNKLGNVAHEMRVPASGLHRAAADAEVTFEIFKRIVRKLKRTEKLHTVQDFVHAQEDDFSLAVTPPPRDLPEALATAASLGQAVSIRYNSANEITERVVQPLWINHRYLIAFCQLRQAQRTFRLDRIEAAWRPDERS